MKTISVSMLLSFVLLLSGCGDAGDVNDVDSTGKRGPLFPVLDLQDEALYINAAGEIALERNEKVTGLEFVDGFAPVMVERKGWGYIDVTGKFVVEPQFLTANVFSEGLARVRDNNFASTFFDTNGKIVFTVRYFVVGDCLNGRILVGNGARGKVGYIDRKGNVIIPTQFDEGHPFSNDVARVKSNGKIGFIDKQGRNVIEARFVEASDFVDGLASAKETADGLFGYVDKQGKWVIKPSFLIAHAFSEDIAMVMLPLTGETKQMTFAFIDKSGRTIIQSQAGVAQQFSEGLCGITRDQPGPGMKWGFIDKTGSVVIKPEYDQVLAFKNGLALVLPKQNGPWQYIDKTGKVVWPKR